MQNQSNQIVRGFEICSLLALIVFTLVITGTILFRQISDWDHETALKEAALLAGEIAYSRLSFDQDELRGPASVSESLGANFREQGEIGKDPWGRPFKYHIVTGGKSRHVVVWSRGPDAADDTLLETLQAQAGQGGMIVFTGDDIGFAKKLR